MSLVPEGSAAQKVSGRAVWQRWQRWRPTSDSFEIRDQAPSREASEGDEDSQYGQNTDEYPNRCATMRMTLA